MPQMDVKNMEILFSKRAKEYLTWNGNA